MLEQFRVSDFLEWHDNKALLINREFQRGSVWSAAARTMLIDTILRDLPVPKIYMRSLIDRDSRRTRREVVDGQQRLRAIIDFAADKITLSSRAKEYAGKKFSTLTDDEKDQFLQYALSVDHLANADDQLVLEIFARLNSYNVKLNAPELRHAEFQGDFKWSAHEKANDLYSFWEETGLFSKGRMVRMYHTSFVAELYGVLLRGIQDGGQPNVRKIYTLYDDDDFDREEVEEKFDSVIDWISENILEGIEGTALLRPAHFLILFAAVAHCRIGIPQGALEEDQFDEDATVADDLNAVRARLNDLAVAIEAEEEPEDLAEFWNASTSSTQRISSRKIRFPHFVAALSDD
ncbi:MAG: DUF262 domain-containing protein [Pseudomonadota bacterium]